MSNAINAQSNALPPQHPSDGIAANSSHKIIQTIAAVALGAIVAVALIPVELPFIACAAIGAAVTAVALLIIFAYNHAKTKEAVAQPVQLPLVAQAVEQPAQPAQLPPAVEEVAAQPAPLPPMSHATMLSRITTCVEPKPQVEPAQPAQLLPGAEEVVAEPMQAPVAPKPAIPSVPGLIAALKRHNSDLETLAIGFPLILCSYTKGFNEIEERAVTLGNDIATLSTFFNMDKSSAETRHKVNIRTINEQCEDEISAIKLGLVKVTNSDVAIALALKDKEIKIQDEIKRYSEELTRFKQPLNEKLAEFFRLVWEFKTALGRTGKVGDEFPFSTQDLTAIYDQLPRTL